MLPRRFLSILAILLVFPFPAIAGPKSELNVIKAIRLQKDGGLSVEIVGTARPNFTTFPMADPPRLVVDLSEAVIDQAALKEQTFQGPIVSIKPANFGSDTAAIARVQITFARETETDLQTVGGTSLVIRVTGDQPVLVAQADLPKDAGPDEAEVRAAAEEDKAIEAQKRAEAERAALEEKKKREDEEKKAAEEQAKADAEEKKRLALQALEEKKAAEEKAKAEAEEQKRLALEEKKAADEKAKAEAAEKKRLALEEKQRLEDEKRAAAERAKEEAEAKRLAVLEEKKRAEEEKRAAVEKARAEAEEKKKAAAEAKKREREEAEAKRLAALEEKKAAAERAKTEAEAKKQAALEEKKRLAEQKRAKAEEARLAAEEKKRAAAQAAADEKKRLAEEKRARAEEQRRLAEEEKARREEEKRAAAAKAKEEAEEKKRLAEEKKQAEEKRRLAADERRADEEKARAEAEEKRREKMEKLRVVSARPEPAAPTGQSEAVESGRRGTVESFGFRQLPGVSRIYVRTDGPVAYRVSEAGDVVVLELQNTSIGKKNNRRFLDTSFFNSPVAMVSPHDLSGHAVRFEIKLKNAASYEARQENGEVHVDFSRP